MKCENCGSEKKFVGSLATGHLECPVCDNAKPVIPDTAAASQEPFSVRMAKERMTKYEDYQSANSGNCPYCARLAGHFDRDKCAKEYVDDETLVTRHAQGLPIHSLSSAPTPVVPAPQGAISGTSKYGIIQLHLVDPTMIHPGDVVDFGQMPSYNVYAADPVSGITRIQIPFLWGAIYVDLPTVLYQQNGVTHGRVLKIDNYGMKPKSDPAKDLLDPWRSRP